MKKLLILIFLLATVNLISAQDNEIEKTDVIVEELADSTVLQTIDWLINSPLEKDPITRHDLQNQLLMWLATTQKVTVNVDFKVVNFIEKNPDLLYYFFCGWTDYAYKSNFQGNDLDANVAGVSTVVNFYNKNKRMFTKDKHIEAYDKLQKNGKLKAHIEEVMNGKKNLGEAWKALNK